MGATLKDLPPEERERALRMAEDGISLALLSMPFAILKAIGWFGLGMAALIIAAKYAGWI